MVIYSRLSIALKLHPSIASQSEIHLVDYLFRHKGYNALIRPVSNRSDAVNVKLELALIQLINLEERSQVMKSNVWLRMTWTDYQLTWEPADFGGIEVVRVSPAKVWKPDIVLFNNADGRYELAWQPNILIQNTGEILWIPPAIYVSSCTINVKYFPYDEQRCSMYFGSWTFDATQVTLDWFSDRKYVDLSDYWKSGSWDILDGFGEIIHDNHSGQVSVTRLVYEITLRRKPLFYTVNLIIPCVLTSLLTICVFYLPADAGEKMTLCISILVALVVFLLLISKILPPTSISVPLISRFLLFTFVLNIIDICITVMIINYNYRTPRTHYMPNWVRLIFMEYLPMILFMPRSDRSKEEPLNKCKIITVPHKTQTANDFAFGRASSVKEIHRKGNKLSQQGKTTHYISRNSQNMQQSSQYMNPQFPHASLYSHARHFQGSYPLVCHPSNDSNLSSTRSTALSRPPHNKMTPFYLKNTELHLNGAQQQSVGQDWRVHSQSSPLFNKNFRSDPCLDAPNPCSTLSYQRNRIQNRRSSEESSSCESIDKSKMTSSSYVLPGGTRSQRHRPSTSRVSHGTFRGLEITEDILQAASAINFIASHFQEEDAFAKIRQDWKYVASVMDRFMLIIYFVVTLGGTMLIMFEAPYIFHSVDQDAMIEKNFGGRP